MLGDPYLMMGQVLKDKVVQKTQPRVRNDSSDRTSRNPQTRRWVDFFSFEHVQEFFVRERP